LFARLPDWQISSSRPPASETIRRRWTSTWSSGRLIAPSMCAVSNSAAVRTSTTSTSESDAIIARAVVTSTAGGGAFMVIGSSLCYIPLGVCEGHEAAGTAWRRGAVTGVWPGGRRLRERQEQLFQLGHAHRGLLTAFLCGLAVSQARRDQLEAGPVECLGDRGELG